jgi:tetratricopeptide (TPR) repeat protein
LGDTDAGLGNELAINQLIAHHSVIFKPDSLLVWVSTSPWQLGKYIAYDLNKIFNLRSEYAGHEIYSSDRDIPADTFLFSHPYRQFERFRKMSRELKELKSLSQSLPVGFANGYMGTNPRFYLTDVNLGEYYYEMDDYDQALRYYNLALDCRLPGLEEKKDLMAIKEKLIKKLHNGHSRD